MTPTQKLAIKVLAFVAIAIAVDRLLFAAFEAAYPRVARMGGPGPSSEGLVHSVLDAGADIVVLGHSRARHNYDPAVFAEVLGGSVFNAGANGQGLWYTRAMVDLVLTRSTPDLFIIDVDPQALVYDQRERDAVAFLAPFIDDSEVTRDLVLGQSRLEPLKYLSRSFRYNSRLAQMGNTAVRGDPDGLGHEPLPERFDPATDPDAAALYGDDPVEADPELEALLRASIEQALDAGARVAVVTSPIYRADGRVDPRFVPLLARVGEIAASAGAPHVVVTIEAHPEFADPARYADATHLNDAAAPGFSRLVAGRIRGGAGPAGP
jgi:hypothetical protein